MLEHAAAPALGLLAIVFASTGFGRGRAREAAKARQLRGLFGHLLFWLSLFWISVLFSIGHGRSSAMEWIVGAVVKATNSGSVEAFFAHFKPGADKGPRRKFLDRKSNGVCGTIEPTIADQLAAHAAIGKEFRHGGVIKGGHLMIFLSAGGYRSPTDGPRALALRLKRRAVRVELIV